MEASKRPTPPGKLLVDVPKIYLNTTTRDQICLLSDDFNGTGLSGTQSSSMPNLVDGISSSHRVSTSKVGAKHCHSEAKTKCKHDSAAKVSQLSVFCSPRVSRKNVRRSSGSTNTSNKLSPCEMEEVAWIKTYEQGRASRRSRGRLDSTSSAESDSSVRSASHVSTCATSDYTRFTSCDRLSMATTTYGNEAVTPDSGKLRRIYSNPEPQFGVGKFTTTENATAACGNLRDSKSCSDLETKLSSVNHSILEERLEQESGNLLSPPPLFPTNLMNNFADSKDPNQSYEQMYDDLYRDSFILGADDTNSNREIRIRQWLQEVTLSVPPNNRHVAES